LLLQRLGVIDIILVLIYFHYKKKAKPAARGNSKSIAATKKCFIVIREQYTHPSMVAMPPSFLFGKYLEHLQ
jgi:hypothetical protein